MITRVVHPFNLQRALEHVIANKGSAGVDGVSIRELRKVFSEKKLQLIEAIKQGNYQVQPILGIEIPKGNGKTAHLQSSVFKLSKDLIDSIHEEGIVAYTS